MGASRKNQQRDEALPESKDHGFIPPKTISNAELLQSGRDDAFRETLYTMVLAFSRLTVCREAFGREMGLTGNQFAVMMGVAYQQGGSGVAIRTLADHVQLASTHVTTEVGALIRKGLLKKKPNLTDRRSVLVYLTPAGEAAIRDVNPLVRKVNDLLFEGVSKSEMKNVHRFLSKLVLNSEYAVAELRRNNLQKAGTPFGER